MRRKLENSHIIITGASQGLGLEIAKRFVAEGADIAICSRSPDALFEAQKMLQSLAKGTQTIFAKTMDIANEIEVKEFVSSVTSIFPKIDVLVSNAGIFGAKGSIEDIDWQEWQKTIQVNLFGPVLMCKYLVPLFKKNLSGKIIQLSGGGATKPLPALGGYAASKAAIIRFMETLAVEVRGFNIDINSIAPGALNTRLLDELI
jgi:NAD(P)-dependent dehydrogenase (short-subunit alcohol dehydrogenase family)